MQYQVLARKYRPQNFTELVGQEHVTQALINGLEQGRLHHAFLFTGTRGVGKTTLARIIAKALNCEKGVTGSPCGECEACREIAEGRFVDLVEVDAASRTGVDDTRELLENVQYAPSKGRYKIYLIDEVHMFSNSSFNALLKTLEEPPPHVKFLLATTEPAKLPITVLSRCLQFNLKRLDNDQISQYLASLLEKEGVEYDLPALELLARAADGSMRDALSLLDQALAYGAGRISLDDVRQMLGVIEQRHIIDLLDGILEHDPDKLEHVMQGLFERSPDYGRILQDLALLLHEISLQQVLGKAPPNSLFERAAVVDFGQRLSPELTQLYYQICVIGHQELSLAPDAKTGFESTVLRLFGFTLPGQEGASPTQNGNRPHARRAGSTNSRPAASASSAPSTSSASAASAPENRIQEQQDNAYLQEAPKSPESAVASHPAENESQNMAQQKEPSPAKADTRASDADLPPLTAENWDAIFQALQLKGAARELARHCRIQSVEGSHVKLVLDDSHQIMLRDRPRNALRKALQQAYGHDLHVSIDTETVDHPVVASPGHSPRAPDRPPTSTPVGPGHRLPTDDPASEAVQANALIQGLQEQFDAEIIDIQRNRKRG